MLLASGANFGLRRTVPHMLGISGGHAAMVALVGLGLLGLFTALPWLRTGLTVVSVAYLLWLAWKIANAAPPAEGAAKGRPLTWAQAAAFQWVNPKAWYMAIYAQTNFRRGGRRVERRSPRGAGLRRGEPALRHGLGLGRHAAQPMADRARTAEGVQLDDGACAGGLALADAQAGRLRAVASLPGPETGRARIEPRSTMTQSGACRAGHAQKRPRRPCPAPEGQPVVAVVQQQQPRLGDAAGDIHPVGIAAEQGHVTPGAPGIGFIDQGLHRFLPSPGPWPAPTFMGPRPDDLSRTTVLPAFTQKTTALKSFARLIGLERHVACGIRGHEEPANHVLFSGLVETERPACHPRH